MTVALGLLVAHWLKCLTVNQKILSSSPKDLFSYGYTQPYPNMEYNVFLERTLSCWSLESLIISLIVVLRFSSLTEQSLTDKLD